MVTGWAPKRFGLVNRRLGIKGKSRLLRPIPVIVPIYRGDPQLEGVGLMEIARAIAGSSGTGPQDDPDMPLKHRLSREIIVRGAGEPDE
jgi:hypothetical protein